MSALSRCTNALNCGSLTVSDSERTITTSLERRGPESRCSSRVWACLESGWLVNGAWVVRAPLRYLEVSNPPTRNSTTQMPITVKRRLALQRATLCGDSLISVPSQPFQFRLVDRRPVRRPNCGTDRSVCPEGVILPVPDAGWSPLSSLPGDGLQHLEQQVEAAGHARTELHMEVIVAGGHHTLLLGTKEGGNQHLGRLVRIDVGAEIALE